MSFQSVASDILEISFLPKDNSYGAWPSSGEIELMRSRGNRELIQNGVNIGVEQINSKLRFGPYATLDGWPTAQFSRNSKQGNGFNNDFHRYQLEWTPGITQNKNYFSS